MDRRIVRRPDVTVGQAASFIVALTLNILVFVPFSPYPLEEGLDASWRLATNYGLSHGFQFGKNLIFTSGPLSFIYTRQYYPGLYSLMLALSVLVIAALTIGSWSVARRSRRVLILALPLLLAQAPDFDAVFLFVPMLLLWVSSLAAERQAKTVVLALLTIVCALLPLVKGSFAVAVVVLGALTLTADGRRRPLRAAGLLALFAATLAVAWLACGQAPASFADYVTSEAQFISGYTDAMSLPGPASEPILFVLAAALILALGAAGLYRRSLACGLGLALTLFLSFKAGFVRQDGHVLIATSALLLSGFLVTVAGQGKVASLALPLAIGAWCLISRPYTAIDTLSDLSRATDAAGRSAGAVWTLAADRGSARRTFEAALAGIRARFSLAGLAGKVDLYPTELSVVLANGLNWDPRPVIQSYSAYTDRLALLNAESLTRPEAPDTVLFQIATIDHRYPALDDGRSWPLLMSRYSPVGLRGDYVELQKRVVSAATAIGAPVADREALFGERVALPAGPIWAEIDVEPSLVGRLVSAAYKLPLLTMTIDYENGTSRDFRFIAAMARGGFLLSPTVEKAAALMALESDAASGLALGPKPVAFAIRSDDATGRLYRKRFHAVLMPIAFPRTPDVDRILFSPLKPYEGDLPSIVQGECVVDAVAQQDGSDIPLDKEAGSLNVRGWAMMSAAEGRPNRDLSMAFIPDSGGETFTADLPKIASPGLAEHFGTPAAGNAAFDADIDVRALPAGRYHLQLLQD